MTKRVRITSNRSGSVHFPYTRKIGNKTESFNIIIHSGTKYFDVEPKLVKEALKAPLAKKLIAEGQIIVDYADAKGNFSVKPEKTANDKIIQARFDSLIKANDELSKVVTESGFDAEAVKKTMTENAALKEQNVELKEQNAALKEQNAELQTKVDKLINTKSDKQKDK